MHCPNCNNELNKSDKYCNECGQKTKSLQISMGHLVGDFFNEYFNFDSRFFKSIGPMLVRPAYLTERFFEGKRNSYVNPLRFYIFISFIAFFLASTISLNFLDESGSSLTLDPESDNIIFSKSNTLGPLSTSTSKDEIDTNKALDVLKMNKDKITQNAFKYLSIAMFFLMPFFAVILYLFFVKRKRYYMEYLIFSFHVHTFIYILLIIAILMSLVFDLPYAWIMMLILSVYTFLAMKNYFKTTFGGTLWRFLLSIGFYNIVLLIAFFGIAFISLYFGGAAEVLSE